MWIVFHFYEDVGGGRVMHSQCLVLSLKNGDWVFLVSFKRLPRGFLGNCVSHWVSHWSTGF